MMRINNFYLDEILKRQNDLESECTTLKHDIKMHAYVVNYLEHSKTSISSATKTSCTASFCISDIETFRHLKNHWVFCSKCALGRHAVCAFLLSSYSTEKMNVDAWECFSCRGIHNEQQLIAVSKNLILSLSRIYC